LNNYCESVNHLINSYFISDTSISFSRFEIIIKSLFIRMEHNKTIKKKEKNKSFNIKTNLSDILLELINLVYWTNLKVLNLNAIKKFKNIKNEIFPWLLNQHNAIKILNIN